MIEAYQTLLTIPEYYFPRIKIEGNHIDRLIHKKVITQASIENTSTKHLLLVKTNLLPPLDEFYITNKKSKNLDNKENRAILQYSFPPDTTIFNENTKLNWLYSPKEIQEHLTPEQISDSWYGKFHFKPEDEEKKIKGLRTPQIGALHAISSEFSRSLNIEPCTVVLPTGTGKTETMLSATVYHRCNKVLVLVPSNSLRDQVGDKFKTLGYLPDLGVVDSDISFPFVSKIKKGIKSIEVANELLKKSNILIATPQILNSKSTSDEILEFICDSCTHLFIDEAHHISAKNWSLIRDKFKGKRIIQFTATPFRNDTQSLGARIIYNYTMSEAQKSGYFTSVQLEPVEEYFQNEMDNSIADKALGILRNDRNSDLDHLLMARTKTKERAENIFKIYQNLAPELHPILVHSSLPKTEQERRLKLLKDKKSKIVICVDMLGEGYDLPNLKIAAIHDHHKSLAVTLQFIGRFTRTSHIEKLGDAKAVVNIADPGIEGALQKLYAIDADWDSVLRRLSANKIEREVRLQQVIDSLKGSGDLHKQLSLWNLNPSFSTMLFKTDCPKWKPERFQDLSYSYENWWHAISEDESLLVILALNSTSVKWGKFKDIKDVNYKILIAHWNEERGALFVNSNDYKGFKVEQLSEMICGESTTVVSGKQVFNVLNGIEYPLVTNLGSAQNGAISFTQFFGSNVTEGLSSVERSDSILSNIAALGFENGDKVLWGCSERKGKVWSPKAGSVTDWLNWAISAWDKIVSGDSDDANITRDFLRPVKITQPHRSKPISVQWGEQFQQRYEDNVAVYFGDKKKHLFEVDLKVDWNDKNLNPVITFQSGTLSSKYELEIDQGLHRGYNYKSLGDEITIQSGQSDPEALIDLMIRDPLYIYYLDGSFSYNCYWIETKSNIGVFEKDNCQESTWPIDIRKESMGKAMNNDCIQYHTWQLIESDFDVIINDDDSGEAADLVALKSLPDKIILSLYHCKYSHGDKPGARLSDLYEVCGQAQRSVRWKHVGLPYVYRHIKLRESQWKSIGSTRFLKGDITELESLKNRSRTTPVEFQVVIVQPGMSKSKATDEMLKLLGTTELFVKKTTLADLQVWCSN